MTERSEGIQQVDSDQDHEASPGGPADRDDAATLLQLQAHYKERGQYAEEAAILRQILSRELTSDQRAEALHDLAFALYHQGQLDDAIQRAEELLELDPDYYYLGSVLWLLGVMYGERSLWHEDLDAWRQDVEAAESNLRGALDHVNDEQERAGVLVELGEALSSSGRLVEAKRAFEKALGIGISDPVTLAACYHRLGITVYSLGQHHRARRCYQQAIHIHPDKSSNSLAQAYIDLASLSREEGDLEQAEQYCRLAEGVLDAAAFRGTSVARARMLEELGDIAFEKGKFHLAADDYQAALQLAPLPGSQQQELYRKIGVSLRWDGQPERALKYLRQALAQGTLSDPARKQHLAALLLDMGLCEYDLRDYQQAIALLRRAAESAKKPLLADVYLMLGHCDFHLKRFGQAAQQYGRVLRESVILSTTWRKALEYFIRAWMAR